MKIETCINIAHKLKSEISEKGYYLAISLLVYKISIALRQHISKPKNNFSIYKIKNRSKKSKKLLVVIAGYKEYLWPATLGRVFKYAGSDIDICIASPGVFSKKLESICSKYNWSYLSIRRNSPGVAMNIAIKLHQEADYIFKLDEDVFIGKDFFNLMLDGYKKSWEDQLIEPGFCAPVLNVNGITYVDFIKSKNIDIQYQSIFGKLIARCGAVPAHYSPEAAYWLWQHSLPFDENVEFFSKKKFQYYVCGTRFSIGAILLRKNFIQQCGGFSSAWPAGILGVDEDQICRQTVSLSRPMTILTNVLVGHFSFGLQEKFMKSKLQDLSKLDPITFPQKNYEH